MAIFCVEICLICVESCYICVEMYSLTSPEIIWNHLNTPEIPWHDQISHDIWCCIIQCQVEVFWITETYNLRSLNWKTWIIFLYPVHFLTKQLWRGCDYTPRWWSTTGSHQYIMYVIKLNKHQSRLVSCVANMAQS